jgi:NADPH2:quinone reductase
MRAIRVQSPGGPEALEYVEVPVPKPGADEVLVRIEAVGVNYIDVYHRRGLYLLALPFTPGSEAGGVVEEVGADVHTARRGDRVVYAMQIGSYAEYAVVPAWKAVPIPDGCDSRTAAAAMLQGLTAHYLTHSTCALAAGDRALVHAAAGGTGALIVQMAKAKGAFVFATASTSKLEIPRGDAADVVIDYTAEDFHDVVMRHTEGAGVRVVYDSVGRTTFDKSLDCVGVRGVLALFGQSSGVVPPVDPARLAKRGIYLTRPSLAHYSASREELLGRSSELFAAIESGRLRVRIAKELPLRDAGEAHRLLEGRATTGKLLLIP